MAMASLKTDPSPEEWKPSPYGYGTCLRLTSDQVEALGLQASPPDAGSRVSIRGYATVVRTEQSTDADGGDGDGDVDVTLELQVTELEVTPGAQTDPAMALYGS